jgi:hypothetical protein
MSSFYILLGIIGVIALSMLIAIPIAYFVEKKKRS